MKTTILVDTKPLALFVTPKKLCYTTANNFPAVQFSIQNHKYSSTMPPLKRKMKGYSSSKNWNFKNRFRSAAASSASESTKLDKGSDNGDGDGQRKVPGLNTLFRRFWKVAAPYWFSEDKEPARLQLAAVFALTLGTTGISVGFSFLGRDFYNALANKDQEQFTKQLLYYLGAFAGGIPVSSQNITF